MVAIVLLGSLHWHIMYCNQAESVEDIPEGFEWTPFHGDVFQPSMSIMSASAGTGMQMYMMTLVSLVFACLGFLSPPNWEALMTTALVLYSMCSLVWCLDMFLLASTRQQECYDGRTLY